MVSRITKVRAMRQEQIMKMLEGENLTVNEIAKRLDAKYATIYADVQMLVNQALITNTGIPRDGAYLFARGSTDQTLQLMKISSGHRTKLEDVICNWPKNNFEPPTQQVATLKKALLVMMAVFEKAEAANNGSTISDVEFSEIKKAANAVISELTDMAGYMRQILAAPIWTTSDLLMLNYDRPRVQALIEAYADHINSLQQESAGGN